MPMNRGAAGVMAGALLVAAALASAWILPPGRLLSGGLMGAGIVVLLGALMVLGVRRSGRKAGALFVGGLVAVATLLLGCFGAALLLPPESAQSPLLLGLPWRAAALVYGVGLVPAVILPLVFAATFRRLVLSDESLAAFREGIASLRNREAGPQ